MKKIFTAALLLFVGLSFAQKDRTVTFNEDTDLMEVVYYHENGEISQTGFYTKEGKLQGNWYTYCQEGNKIASAKYNQGRKVGKWFYWKNDTLKEVDYTNNTIANVSEWTNKKVVASN